jgi:hypothetical protein
MWKAKVSFIGLKHLKVMELTIDDMKEATVLVWIDRVVVNMFPGIRPEQYVLSLQAVKDG